MTNGSMPALIILGIAAVLGAMTRKRRRRSGSWNRSTSTGTGGTPLLDLSDHGDQLKAVEAATLKPKKPVNTEVSRILIQLEQITRQRPVHGYRIFAQMSLGAFIATEGPGDRKEIGHLAWRAISAKRHDFLIIDGRGYPAVAIEYHVPATLSKPDRPPHAMRLTSSARKGRDRTRRNPGELRHPPISDEGRACAGPLRKSCPVHAGCACSPVVAMTTREYRCGQPAREWHRIIAQYRRADTVRAYVQSVVHGSQPSVDDGV